MWHYQEFMLTIDGIDHRAYTMHGIEAFTPSTRLLRYHHVYAFQFGVVVSMWIDTDNEYGGDYEDQLPYQLYYNMSPTHGEPCEYCDGVFDTILVKRRDDIINACNMCYRGMLALVTTKHAIAGPHLSDSQHRIYLDPSCCIDAAHHYIPKPGCTCVIGNRCAWCLYSEFLRRATVMLWSCHRALEKHLGIVDVAKIIVEYVLSGVDLEWHGL